MKKVKLGGRQKKTTIFMSEDEEDGGLGLDGRLEGGEEEDNLARSSSFLSDPSGTDLTVVFSCPSSSIPASVSHSFTMFNSYQP